MRLHRHAAEDQAEFFFDDICVHVRFEMSVKLKGNKATRLRIFLRHICYRNFLQLTWILVDEAQMHVKPVLSAKVV